MSFVDRLKEIPIHSNQLAFAEREHSFTTPLQLCAVLPQIHRLIDSVAFQEQNPGFDVVTTQGMKAAWDGGLPTELIPFCLQLQPAHTDYYCFYRTADDNQAIVVFADHSIVHDWPDANAFLAWLESPRNAE